MWEFSVGLYMISIWPDSLLFTAIYGVVESASIALFGSLIGKWVDRLSYAQVHINFRFFWFFTESNAREKKNHRTALQKSLMALFLAPGPSTLAVDPKPVIHGCWARSCHTAR